MREIIFVIASLIAFGSLICAFVSLAGLLFGGDKAMKRIGLLPLQAAFLWIVFAIISLMFKP